MDAVVANRDGSGIITIAPVDAANNPCYEDFHPDTDADGVFVLPVIPDTVPAIQTLLWPLEELVVRSFSLPLPSLRLLDADLLGQELEDLSGVDSGAWWLSWQAKKTEEGIEGVVFALPVAIKSALSTHRLGDCKYIWPDGWVRLNALLSDPEAEMVAILDTDEQGLFLGVHNHGIWLGMRRLNFVSSRSVKDLANDIYLSLTAMGCTSDTPVFGRLGHDLVALLEKRLAWQGELQTQHLCRRRANIEAAQNLPDTESGPNFRHLSWAARADWVVRILPWRRAAILATLVVAIAFFSDVYTLSALKHKMKSGQEGISTLFHQALPAEKVIIDPIAQLRNAAGSSANNTQSWYYLRQLEAVAKLKDKFQGLVLREVSLADGGMILDGDIDNFSMVNKARDELSKLIGGSVQVVDTELDKEAKHVRFRMKWS